MTAGFLISSKEILQWRSSQLSLGGSSSDIDWLIDIAGGLGWEELQRLKIFQRGDFLLSTSLENLELIWRKHINENVPLPKK